MKKLNKIASAVLSVALASSVTQAQVVNYTTQGSFTGCDGGVTNVGVSISCTKGAATLVYSYETAGSVVNSGSGNFGSFQMFGGASSSSTSFSGVSFKMAIAQTTPQVGGQEVSGAISGSVSYNAGQLLWGPIAPVNFFIGSVAYALDVDANTNGIRINPPGAAGVPGTSTIITGRITSTVPEPSTYALMAAGLAGMALVARRRRNSTV